MTTLLHVAEDAEQAVLDVIAARNSALDEVQDLIASRMFARRHRRCVFDAMQAIYAAGKPIDAVTIRAQLQADGTLGDVGLEFIYQLGAGMPRSQNVVSYALIVREKSLLRDAETALRRLLASAQDPEAKAADVLEQADNAIRELTQTSERSSFVSGATLANEAFETIERIEASHGAMTGVLTGFRDVDAMTRGLLKGDLWLVAGRPGNGKTSFAMQVVFHAGGQTIVVAVFSVEMSRAQLALRGVTTLAHVDHWRILSGRLNDVDHFKIGTGISQMAAATFYVDDNPTISPVLMRAKLRRLAAEVGPIGLVVIDYLQLMQCMPEDKRENETKQISGISRALKIMAREFDVPFLVLSQLNRASENRAEKRPQLSDLRGSGSLEQDADAVLLLHRPELYDEQDPSLKGVALAILAKQRSGPTGDIALRWHGPQMRFDDEATP